MINYEKTNGPKVRPIVVWPDERLKRTAIPFNQYDFKYNNEMHQLAADLYWTMRSQNGIGLAAPQIGVNRRMIVIQQVRMLPPRDPAATTPSFETVESPLVLINPVVIEQSEETYQWEEGCLSVPGYFEKRRRPAIITVQSQEYSGETYQATYSGLAAFCIQHEIDHLDGICFVDSNSLLKKQIIKRKITKALKRTNRIQEENVDTSGM